MKAWRWLVVALCLAAARAGASDVPLEIEEEVVRYAVPGQDLEGLRAALRSQTLAEQAGGSHGRTHSRISLRYSPEQVPGGCGAREAAVALRITTTLPEWQPGATVGPALLARWEAVAAALQRHESRHREHALAAARDLQASLARLGMQGDCDALRRAVDRAFLRATTRAQYEDARYDNRTRNGLEEGIAL